MSMLFNVIVWFFLAVSANEAARILGVFPVPSISHQVVFRPLTHELAKRGHEVIVITTDPAFSPQEAPANLTEIDVHDISYNEWRERFLKSSKGSENDFAAQIQLSLKLIAKIFDAQLSNKQVKKILDDKNQKFDLILVEACARPALVFSYKYKAPVIVMSSFGAFFDSYDVIGAPVHKFLYPTAIHQRINNLTTWEKVRELYHVVSSERIFENNKAFEHEILKKHFGNSVPSPEELKNNIDMLFLNIHPLFEGIRPVPPTVVYTGGLHQKPDKELPPDLKSYLDSAKHGVIYMSFGTNVDPSFLAPEKIQTFVEVFSKLPYNVLWKWNNDELPGRTNNIRISKWLPQSDLLKHPKIKLFIMQGGLQSTDEAITAGVPMIGVPMLGDQWFNVEKYEYHKIGIRLDLHDLTADKLTKSINTIIGDESYRRNIVRLREHMRDEPMSPLERAVWWTEYVLRHGGAKHLRSPAANISWAEYLELRLVFTVLVYLFIIVAFIIVIIGYIYKSVFENNVNVKLKSS